MTVDEERNSQALLCQACKPFPKVLSRVSEAANATRTQGGLALSKRSIATTSPSKTAAKVVTVLADRQQKLNNATKKIGRMERRLEDFERKFQHNDVGQRHRQPRQY